MPIYEYTCQACGKFFDAFVQSSTVPECPACHSQALKKELSVFAVGSDNSSAAASFEPMGPGACGSCGDPRGPGSCAIN